MSDHWHLRKLVVYTYKINERRAAARCTHLRSFSLNIGTVICPFLTYFFTYSYEIFTQASQDINLPAYRFWLANH